MNRGIIVLFILCVTTSCGSRTDGLRVEWTELPTRTGHEATTNGEPGEIIESSEALIEDEDVYTLDVDITGERFHRATFYDPSDGRFLLRTLVCSWQADRCIGRLPYEARRSHYFVLGPPGRRSPRVRLFRNGLEIDVWRHRRVGCVFSLGAMAP